MMSVHLNKSFLCGHFTLIFNLQEVKRKAKRIVTAIGHETQQIFFVVVFKFD